MTSSKTEILSAIRRNRPAPAELPSIAGEWTTFADRRQRFVEILEAVGGRAISARDVSDMNDQLQALPIFVEASHVASLVDGITAANVDLSAIDSPHQLENVDIAVLSGEFAVAENAAVWVSDRDLRHRVLFFLCQHLVLVVPAHEVVDHLHAAYERLAASRDGAGEFAEPMFGAFISGPSKTADIEQSLVIGAHGPRSLTVVLLGE
jgi:L-lactate dehydrogenase complex protein LldG